MYYVLAMTQEYFQIPRKINTHKRLVALLLLIAAVMPMLHAQSPFDPTLEVPMYIHLPLNNNEEDSAVVEIKMLKTKPNTLQVGNGKRPAVGKIGVGSLTIPGEVTIRGKSYAIVQVADSAFANCENLVGVTFSSGIASFGSAVFYQCPSLKSVTFKGAVTHLPSDMIRQCPSLTTIRFATGSSLETLPREFMRDFSSLVYVYLPQGLTTIEPLAFKGCTSLSQITLPASVQSLGDSAFYGCSKLQSIVLPEALTQMGDSVLAGCKALRYVDMRQATQLPIPVDPRTSGPLAEMPYMTLIYTPTGMDSIGGINVIATDTLGVMACEHFVIDREEMTLEQCLSGEATYRLNRYYGGSTFRQYLGEHNYPIPSSAYLYRVYRVSFTYLDSVYLNRYANTGQSIRLPSHEELGIAYPYLTYTYQYLNKPTAFTPQVTINQDINVTIGLRRSRCDVNGDGVINVQDVTAVINRVLGVEPGIFYEQNADANGDQEVNVQDVTAIISRILRGDNKQLLDGGLNILVLGNSYACDAYSYMPYILQKSMPEVAVNLGILHQGSCSLASHYNSHLLNNEPYNRLYTFNEHGRWEYSTPDVVTLDSALNCKEWDIIMLQQYSYQSRTYQYYQPYLDNLVDSLRHRLPNVHFGWLLTPAYAEGYGGLKEGETSDSMFCAIAACAQTLMNNNCVNFVIPAGTAIQNARHTELDSLGKYGHLTYEGLHLQDGLPCLIEALTAAQAIADYVGIDAPVDDVNMDITTTWAQTTIATPQFMGPVVGMTDDYVRLGKQCVQAAITKPYEISLINR